MKAAVAEMFFKHLLPVTAENVGHYIDTFISNSKAIGVSGMIALVLLSYSLFNAVEEVFQAIWNVKGNRSFIQKILIFTNVLFWTPLIMGASVYLRARLEFVYHANVVTELTLTVAAILLPWVGFSAAYVIIPAAKVRLKSAVLGGFVATVLWYFLLYGFDAYVKYTQSMQALSKLYGSLVVIPIFLIWIYFCWVISFLGAEVAFYHQFPEFRAFENRRADFFTILEILIFVASEYERGRGGVEESEIMAKCPGAFDALNALVSLGLLSEVNGEYLLRKPPERISLEELYERFGPREGVKTTCASVMKGIQRKTLRDCLA